MTGLRLIQALGLIAVTLLPAAWAEVTTVAQVRASGDIAVAANGTIYLSDFGPPNQANGNSIDRISPDGSVVTFVTGLGRALEGNAVDSQGNLIQVGFNSNAVYRIDPAGNVTTIASLAAPVGVAVDAADTIYLTQCRADAVLRLEADGSLTTLAAGNGLRCPNGLDVGHDGALYVVNNVNGGMLRVGLDGQVTSFATIPGGGNGHVVFVDGFYYVAGRLAHRIYQVDTSGNVTPYAGTGVDGESDGPNLQATISRPNGIGHSPDGRFLYVIGSSDFSAATLPVRRIDLPAAEEFPINGGLSGAWFDPDTAGQGFMFDVIMDSSQIALAWFTFGTQPASGNALVGSDGHEWLTAQGSYAGGTAQMDITLTTGGVFDDPQAVTNTPDGTLTLTFHSCTEATLDYTLNDGRSGRNELIRATPPTLCETLAPPSAKAFNLPPRLSVLSTIAGDDTVRVQFTAEDPENDVLEIRVNAVSESGASHQVPPDYLDGDAGYPVRPGTARDLAWRYRQDPGFADLGGERFRLELTADDRYVAGIGDIVNLVDETRLVEDVAFMQQDRRHFSAGPGHLQSTRNHLRQQMVERGLAVTQQSFNWQGDTGINVIGILPGRNGSQAYYILDGHYDTVSTTRGADDNASGTAGMLEAMRVLSQFNARDSIRFIGFDKEELGLRGSRHYASSLPPGESVLGMLNFEMIGYTCRGQPECAGLSLADTAIYNVYPRFNNTLAGLFAEVGRAHVPGLKIVTVEDDGDSNLRRSDHAPFWDIGVDALFLTDGANFRTPHYHRPTDLLDVMDTQFMTQVVKVAVGTLARAAGVTHTDTVATDLVSVP
ncbi:MAG: M28 family peptidase [Xanthomonadales bacterium]|nr:M28 family peptidase [Xanthomonadales bacterium]